MSKQREVYQRFSQDFQISTTNFPRSNGNGVLDMDNLISIFVSTSIKASVIFAARGLHQFAYNTFSENPENPWIIATHFLESSDLSVYLNDKSTFGNNFPGAPVMFATIDRERNIVGSWQSMTLDPPNTYHFTHWDFRAWLHSPREEALRGLLSDPSCKPFRSTLRDAVNSKKVLRAQHALSMLALKAQEIGCNSFQYPTLQLRVSCNDASEDRYEPFHSGNISCRNNSVHLRFARKAYVPRKIGRKEVFDATYYKDQPKLTFQQCIEQNSI